MQNNNWEITTKKVGGKLPLFSGNRERLIPIYAWQSLVPSPPPAPLLVYSGYVQSTPPPPLSPSPLVALIPSLQMNFVGRGAGRSRYAHILKSS